MAAIGILIIKADIFGLMVNQEHLEHGNQCMWAQIGPLMLKLGQIFQFEQEVILIILGNLFTHHVMDIKI